MLSWIIGSQPNLPPNSAAQPSQPASAAQPDLPAHVLELRAEIAQLAEQLKKLTDKLAFLENAVKPADQIAAEPQNARPTFAELKAEFGLFDLP